MKKSCLLLGLALLAGLPFVAAAQAPEARTYTPGPFDSIEIAGSADVRFTQGPSDQIVDRVAVDHGHPPSRGVRRCAHDSECDRSERGRENRAAGSLQRTQPRRRAVPRGC